MIIELKDYLKSHSSFKINLDFFITYLSISYTINYTVYTLARILINQKAQRYESKNFSLP